MMTTTKEVAKIDDMLSLFVELIKEVGLELDAYDELVAAENGFTPEAKRLRDKTIEAEELDSGLRDAMHILRFLRTAYARKAGA